MDDLNRGSGDQTGEREGWSGQKTLTPRSVPVSIFETPPLEINLLRKASSLLRNESRASASIRFGLSAPNLWSRAFLLSSPVSYLFKFGALGELSIPQNPSPTRWKFIYARDDFHRGVPQPVCQPPLAGSRSPPTVLSIYFRRCSVCVSTPGSAPVQRDDRTGYKERLYAPPAPSV